MVGSNHKDFAKILLSFTSKEKLIYKSYQKGEKLSIKNEKKVKKSNKNERKNRHNMKEIKLAKSSIEDKNNHSKGTT